MKRAFCIASLTVFPCVLSALGQGPSLTYSAAAYTAVPNSMLGLEPSLGIAGFTGPLMLALVSLGGLSLLIFRRRS